MASLCVSCSYSGGQVLILDISRVFLGDRTAQAEEQIASDVVETVVPYSEWRKQVIAKWLGMAYLVVLAAMILWLIISQVAGAPRITIATAPVSFDFEYKCRLCGADNHIKEEVK